MSHARPWTCAQCGEQIEGKLSTCWNCGMGKDGAPPEDLPEFNFVKKTRTVPPDSSPDPTSKPLLADHKHAFDLLYESDELEELLRYRPSSTRPMAWNVFWMSLGLVFVTLAIIGRFESNVTAVLTVLGASPLMFGLYDLLKFGTSPLKRVPAIVVDKSKKVYAGGELVGGGTILMVSIESRNGSVHHYQVGLELHLNVEKNDIGVAYIRSGQMLDFRKATLAET
ncbi:MAG: hypothetical protein JSW66_10250 [Phycisphaerales bacterium]|nr:MAG: hypothetical protein JSW66_10250 [Phycisphaerales bacterium]